MLYLVIDDSSGEASTLVLAGDEKHAIDLARPTLDGDAEEPSDLRAVCADTTTNPQTRALLKFWGDVTTEATRVLSDECVMRELNGLDAVMLRAGASAFDRVRSTAMACERAALRQEIERRREEHESKSRWAAATPKEWDARAADAARLGEASALLEWLDARSKAEVSR